MLAASEAARREPIAIVGAGCRFPGGARDLESLWRLLETGADAVGEPPADRWESPSTPYAMTGGFLESVETFDPVLFGISDAEAEAMDPQQRLLLEVCWEALEDAAIAADGLVGSRTGVYVGMNSDDYALLVTRANAGATPPLVGLGSARAIAAGRLAHVLGLQGPAMQLDTMCSSSLVAIHLACQALRAGSIDAALAGGVNLMLSPEHTIATGELGVLSASGRCRSFSADADGYVRGEGCGVVVLERLAHARAAGHRVLAVIRGSDANHGGRSNGLTAPNGAAQRTAIRRALDDAGVAPESIQYVEAQGTGTPLGDSIELAAIGDALTGARREALVVGTIKSNIGHLEAASGVASVLKTVVALGHGRIPANLHFRAPNPHVAWGALGLEVATATRAWPIGDGARRASINAFGMSGTNVHLVLEEAPSDARALEAAASRDRELVLLSAMSASALRRRAADLHAWLSREATGSLADIAHTLRVGRVHLPHRLAVIATTRTELAEALAEIGAGKVPERTWLGEASGAPLRDDGGAEASLEALAARYVRGARIVDGASSGVGDGPRTRIALPTYPFERRPFWLPLLARPRPRVHDLERRRRARTRRGDPGW